MGKSEPLMARELYYPCISTFMRGLPHTYRNVAADEGTVIKTIVNGNSGGSWFLIKKHGQWALEDKPGAQPKAAITLNPDIAWKLFTKGIPANLAISESKLEGDKALAEPLFSMISVIA